MLVNELNKKDKENFKSLGKSLGLEIKKGLHRNTSVNEYVCFNVHCSKGVFDTIRTFCVTEIWKPSRKTRNCNRDTHFKICSQAELEKFIKNKFYSKNVMFSST